jgi:hypothetical protein
MQEQDTELRRAQFDGLGPAPAAKGQAFRDFATIKFEQGPSGRPVDDIDLLQFDVSPGGVAEP